MPASRSRPQDRYRRECTERDLSHQRLRHKPEGDTSGWYIWAGEALEAGNDFFLPLHISHLEQWRPEIVKYLGLPPGWRFLIAPGHEDGWFDAALLDVRIKPAGAPRARE